MDRRFKIFEGKTEIKKDKYILASYICKTDKLQAMNIKKFSFYLSLNISKNCNILYSNLPNIVIFIPGLFGCFFANFSV
jgi:hypothetical protein